MCSFLSKMTCNWDRVFKGLAHGSSSGWLVMLGIELIIFKSLAQWLSYCPTSALSPPRVLVVQWVALWSHSSRARVLWSWARFTVQSFYARTPHVLVDFLCFSWFLPLPKNMMVCESGNIIAPNEWMCVFMVPIQDCIPASLCVPGTGSRKVMDQWIKI